jgi:hypothetical protein
MILVDRYAVNFSSADYLYFNHLFLIIWKIYIFAGPSH